MDADASSAAVGSASGHVSDSDPTDVTALIKTAYRGCRYGFGYPACPDLEDRAKIVDLWGRRVVDTPAPTCGRALRDAVRPRLSACDALTMRISPAQNSANAT